MPIIDSRKRKQRAQTSFSYTASNRNYNNRLMITHSTGVSKKVGHFHLVAAGAGQMKAMYRAPIIMDGVIFLAVDKRIGQNHLLSLAVFGAPTENGRQRRICK